jgi:predicted HAD superfamily Cof-like phosphohydrolase
MEMIPMKKKGIHDPMKQAALDVALFHSVTDVPVLTTPQFPSAARVGLRCALVGEEVNSELSDAILRRDLPDVADAIIDSIYVLIGMGHEFGLPLEALWAEVQRANMTKAVRQPDGTFQVVRRADGKIMKPEGFTPPAIEGILRAYGWKPEGETT